MLVAVFFLDPALMRVRVRMNRAVAMLVFVAMLGVVVGVSVVGVRMSFAAVGVLVGVGLIVFVRGHENSPRFVYENYRTTVKGRINEWVPAAMPPVPGESLRPL